MLEGEFLRLSSSLYTYAHCTHKKIRYQEQIKPSHPKYNSRIEQAPPVMMFSWGEQDCWKEDIYMVLNYCPTV